MPQAAPFSTISQMRCQGTHNGLHTAVTLQAHGSSRSVVAFLSPQCSWRTPLSVQVLGWVCAPGGSTFKAGAAGCEELSSVVSLHFVWQGWVEPTTAKHLRMCFIKAHLKSFREKLHLKILCGKEQCILIHSNHTMYQLLHIMDAV